MPAEPRHVDQAAYQVRLDWGVNGLARLAAADVIVVVDVLRFSSTVIAALEAGDDVGPDAPVWAASINGAAVARAAATSGAVVLAGGLRNAGAVAGAVMRVQEQRGARTSIAVIAAGELVSTDTGAPLRFAVEDQLGAGAIVDALAAIGIDHCSPEAVSACESFRALRGAVRHLLTASGSGRELIDLGRRDQVIAAAAVDAASVAPVLRDGTWVAA